MKKWWIYALAIVAMAVLIPICIIYGGTPIVTEKAICKIGNKSYSSLAEAISVCDNGGTIYIFNDVKEDINNQLLKELHLTVSEVYGKTYTAYNIDKNITLKGVTQNRKQPKVYGSLNLSAPSNSKITIENLEIINDYISLEDDSLNLPFKNAVQVLDGQVTITDCKINKSNQVDNSIVNSNNLSCLNGIQILRKTNDGQKLNYNLKNLIIDGYNNFTSEDSSCAISFVSQREGFSLLEPFSVNTDSLDISQSLDTFNKKMGENNNVLYSVYNEKEGFYTTLKTFNKNLIKEDNFIEGSYVEFLGEEFGYEEKTTFNVYGKMKFKKVKNIHFVIKTISGSINATERENVTVKVYAELS